MIADITELGKSHAKKLQFPCSYLKYYWFFLLRRKVLQRCYFVDLVEDGVTLQEFIALTSYAKKRKLSDFEKPFLESSTVVLYSS